MDNTTIDKKKTSILIGFIDESVIRLPRICDAFLWFIHRRVVAPIKLIIQYNETFLIFALKNIHTTIDNEVARAIIKVNKDIVFIEQ